MSEPFKYFGTDGIRGRIGTKPISADFILQLGWAVGTVLKSKGARKILIGRDTRISGHMLESALEAGLSSAGIDCYLLGLMPTSAIAYLTRTLRAKLGIVISASHNPYYDNGIKFFSEDGYKISTELAEAFEAQIAKPFLTIEGNFLGSMTAVPDAAGRYIEFCKSTVPHHLSLANLKIVVDCANGATYNIAPNVFRELGATVFEMNTNPNGININVESGSIHPEFLQKAVRDEQADLGIAFDGDGDRVIMVDNKGEILDGDQLLFIIVNSMLGTKYFRGGVVGTVMSNLGLELALSEKNIPFVRVPVGDQHVIAELLKRDWVIGGESSGHIIYLTVTTTADGIISALQVLQAMVVANRSLHDIKQSMHLFPQVHKNIPLQTKKIDLAHPDLIKAIQSAEKTLGKQGRLLIRPSGTEPVIRIMAEGENTELLNTIANDLAGTITSLLK